jgi:glycosyltransferase involved in cell wall biosynthesis
MSRRPLRVLAVIDGLGFGGAEMLLAELAAAGPSAGFELQVAYLREKDGNPAAERLRAVGVEPVHLPIDGLLSRSSFRSVRAGIASLAPDVVHSQLGYSDLLAGAGASRLKIPAVSSMHVMEWEGDARDRFKLALFAWARRRWMARVVAVSAAGRRAYLARRWDRPERVTVVHNGVRDSTVPGAGRAVRRELGIADDELVLTMLTVLRPGKGHAAAIAAIARLRELGRPVRLVVLGDGPSRHDIEALATPLGAAVVLAGHRDDVPAVLDATDVLLHPSEVDAFPTALLEAMAAATPIVATRVGGIPEIVDDGVTGVLIDAPATAASLVGAIEPLLADAGRRGALAAAGRRRFEEHFTAERWAARLRAVYDEVRSAT